MHTSKIENIKSSYLVYSELWRRRMDAYRKKNIKKLEATEMWFYRRMLRISWKDKRTNVSILEELNTKRELVFVIVKRE